MKDLHSIPIDKFTITQQQVYDELLRFITIIRQKVKNNLRHVYNGEIEWSHQYKNPKTSNDYGIGLGSFKCENKHLTTLATLALLRFDD